MPRCSWWYRPPRSSNRRAIRRQPKPSLCQRSTSAKTRTGMLTERPVFIVNLPRWFNSGGWAGSPPRCVPKSAAGPFLAYSEGRMGPATPPALFNRRGLALDHQPAGQGVKKLPVFLTVLFVPFGPFFSCAFCAVWASRHSANLVTVQRRQNLPPWRDWIPFRRTLCLL